MSGFIQQLTQRYDFPYGTLFVNLSGCLVIGLLSQLAETRGVFTPEARAFVFIGILGGYTTFSTFGNETFNLFRDGQNAYAFANLAGQIVLGIAAVWLGRVIAHLVWR
jgi:CrcB protein